MEPVLFYGVPGGCSLASIIALEWLGQPYKLCRIEMLEQPWPPYFTRFNPRMKTPALRLGGGGASLTESAAILQHIGARGVKQGLGFRQGTLESDRLTEMLSYLTTDFFAAFAPLWKSYEGQGLGEERKQQMRAEGLALVRHEFGHVERMLGERTWLLGGEAPTVADAYLFAVSRWADYHRLFDTQALFPAIHRHADRIRNSAAGRFALGIEEGKNVRGGGAFRGHVTLDELAGALVA